MRSQLSIVRSLVGFWYEMQSKLFGNRSVLDIGVSSHISNVNESSGIVSNKVFTVLGGFERFSKSCCPNGQDW